MSCFCTGACRWNGGKCPNLDTSPSKYGWWCPNCKVTVNPTLDTCPTCKPQFEATFWGVPLSEWEVNGVYSGNCTNPGVFVRGGKQNE